MKYGFSDAEWKTATAQMTVALHAKAKNRGLITYSDLSASISNVAVGYHDPAMDQMLYEVSLEDLKHQPGILSALVVHKREDMEPGAGFFRLAESLGRDTTDRTKCWIEECKVVWDYWAN